MNVFTRIDDAKAFLRLPKGVYKETDIYARQQKVYVPHGGGFIQIRGAFQDTGYGTSSPDVRVLELHVGEGLVFEKVAGVSEPRVGAK